MLDVRTNREHMSGNGTPLAIRYSPAPAVFFGRRIERIGSMLAIAISLLFGFAACAALIVVHASLVTGARRARQILAELAEMDRVELPRIETAGMASRVRAKRYSRPLPQPALAAA